MVQLIHQHITALCVMVGTLRVHHRSNNKIFGRKCPINSDLYQSETCYVGPIQRVHAKIVTGWINRYAKDLIKQAG